MQCPTKTTPSIQYLIDIYKPSHAVLCSTICQGIASTTKAGCSRQIHKHWQIHVLYYVDIKCNVYSGSLICVCVHAGAWRARKTQVYCNNNKEHGAWQQHRVELLTWS